MLEAFLFGLVISINVATVRRAYKWPAKTLVAGYVFGAAFAFAFVASFGSPSFSVLVGIATVAACTLVAVDFMCRLMDDAEETPPHNEGEWR